MPVSALSQWEECRTPIPKAQIERELQRIASNTLPSFFSMVSYPYHIPVSIHVVRFSDGTGGMSVSDVNLAMQILNSEFEEMDMIFFQHGSIDYINSDYFHTVPDSEELEDELRDVNFVSNTVNLYFTNLTNKCGSSAFTFSTFQGILIDSSCATNPSSTPHEVGHHFDLYHTHEDAVGIECPDGSHCGSRGDLVCDTPADPGQSGRVDTATCTYDNSASPPAECDATPYSPQVNNMMSYAPKDCRTDFTSGQRERALNTLTSDRTNLYTRTIYVDGSSSGLENGTPEKPYDTLSEGITDVSSGNYLIVNSGNYAGAITISKSLKLRKWNTTSSNVIIGK
ncbi:MAG: hypothetical protein HY960_15025 [Ignavibacteriae bacterium]|nr:hypothetical protein [Ignavibacteriota bacterium]